MTLNQSWSVKSKRRDLCWRLQEGQLVAIWSSTDNGARCHQACDVVGRTGWVEVLGRGVGWGWGGLRLSYRYLV